MGYSYKDKSFRQTYKITQPEFWKNLWFYDGKIIIISAIVLAVIIGSVIGCIRTVTPDIQIIYTISVPTPYETFEALNAEFSEITEDINGDKKNVAEIMEIYLPDEVNNEIYMANSVKLAAEISSGDANIIIGQKDILNNMFPINEYMQISSSDDIPDKGGCYMDITSSPLARKLGYKGDDTLYYFIREAPEKERKTAAFNEAIRFSKQLLK